MNDGYEEILVKRQKTPKDTLVKGLVIGVVAVLLAGGIFFFNPIFLAAGMVLGMLAYYLILPMLDLEHTYAKDDYTVVMTLTQYDLSYIYSMTSLMIFDKESYDADKIAQEPIGTGPYKVKEYVVNSHITLERRDDYWVK